MEDISIQFNFNQEEVALLKEVMEALGSRSRSDTFRRLVRDKHKELIADTPQQ